MRFEKQRCNITPSVAARALVRATCRRIRRGCRYGAIFVHRKKKRKKVPRVGEMDGGGKRPGVAAESPRCCWPSSHPPIRRFFRFLSIHACVILRFLLYRALLRIFLLPLGFHRGGPCASSATRRKRRLSRRLSRGEGYTPRCRVKYTERDFQSDAVTRPADIYRHFYACAKRKRKREILFVNLAE